MYGFGNWIVTTPPVGDNSNRVADTAFVQQAIASFGAFPTPSGTGSLIYWSGSNWTALAGNASGTATLQENASGIPAWAAAAAAAGTLVSITTYSGSQTITIPATATKAFIRMWGGSGGSGGTGGGISASPGGGAGGYLEKYLTGITPGNTVIYTQGAAGAAGVAGGLGGSGTASTLASGTQTITTLTANGGSGSVAGVGSFNFMSTAGGAGGTATNGDLNITGGTGGSAIENGDTVSIVYFAMYGSGGKSPYAPGADGIATNTSTAGNAGRSGGLVIFWFT